MKTTVFIFHGTAGYPQENWFPWLRAQLEPLGCRVIVPQFPTPEGQTPEKWLAVFRDHEDRLNEHSILIGHSLGGAFLLRLLESIDVSIKAAFLVAAPVGVMPIKNYQTDRPFLEKPFDWNKIRKNCGQFFVFHSDDDPLVAPGNGETLAQKLDTRLIRVPHAGHFNTPAGYNRFPLLAEKIRPLL